MLSLIFEFDFELDFRLLGQTVFIPLKAKLHPAIFVWRNQLVDIRMDGLVDVWFFR